MIHPWDTSTPEWIELKEQWAYFMLTPGADIYKVTEKIIPNRANEKYGHIITHWPTDTYVKYHQKRLLEHYGADHFLPKKEDIAASLWERAHAKYIEPKDYEKIMRLYAEVVGTISKGQIKADPKDKVQALTIVLSKEDETL